MVFHPHHEISINIYIYIYIYHNIYIYIIIYIYIYHNIYIYIYHNIYIYILIYIYIYILIYIYRSIDLCPKSQGFLDTRPFFVTSASRDGALWPPLAMVPRRQRRVGAQKEIF